MLTDFPVVQEMPSLLPCNAQPQSAARMPQQQHVFCGGSPRTATSMQQLHSLQMFTGTVFSSHLPLSVVCSTCGLCLCLQIAELQEMVGWLTNLQHFIKDTPVNPTPRDLPVGLLDPKVRELSSVPLLSGAVVLFGCVEVVAGQECSCWLRQHRASWGLRPSVGRGACCACQHATTFP